MRFEALPTLITGASRGLGAALAEQLAAAGARVVLVGRDPIALEAQAGKIRAAGGIAHALPADIADKDAIYRLSGAAAALVGPIRLLIHNASTLGPLPLPLLQDLDCEALEAVLQTNLVGPFRLSKALVGNMALHGEGVVLHISSDAAANAYPGWGAYGVSKTALDHLSRSFAAELDGTGVRFLSVDPGEMDTRMHADAMPDADPSTLAQPADVAARILGWLARETGTGLRVEAAGLGG